MRLLPALLISSMLTACSAPDTQSPNIETPSLWSRLTGNATPLVMDEKAGIDQKWWTHFSDPTLNTLIDEALANNKTLQIAQARVQEARAGRQYANSLLFPMIDAVASSSRGNDGILAGDKVGNFNEAGLQASWEFDLFGGNRARSRQAKAILQSETANERAVRVALLSEVARNYFDMRNYERQVDIVSRNLETQRKTLELTNAQFEGAFASGLDVQRAGAQVSTTESQLPVVKAAYEASLNRLNVLVGKAPGARDELLKTPQTLTPLDAQIVIAAPATVIANRPDIRAAERRFAASVSASDFATAQLFPNISLLAFFGVQDSDRLSASPWSIGANLVQPVLHFGQITAGIDAADAQEQQALLTYQQTVLEALEDMENALSSYLHENERNASLAKAVEQNNQSVSLSKEQFTGGYTGLLDVLIAERNALQSESDLAASDANLRKALVTIYAAAGGGWDMNAPTPAVVPDEAPVTVPEVPKDQAATE